MVEHVVETDAMIDLEKELDESSKKSSTSDNQTRHDVKTNISVVNNKIMNMCKIAQSVIKAIQKLIMCSVTTSLLHVVMTMSNMGPKRLISPNV